MSLAIRDDMQAALQRELLEEGVVGVNHLASTGESYGTGNRLMQEVAKDAARQGKGIGLNSLTEAKPFYERLGFVAPNPARPNDLYLSALNTKRLAGGGR